jgi:hypothetical protein
VLGRRGAVPQRPGERSPERCPPARASTDKTTVEPKSRDRAGGGTVSTTETTREHERPGLGNDTKTKSTETVERDAAGNVVRHEKKIEK